MVHADPRSQHLPEGWNTVGRAKRGGQATANPIKHEDGREGFYRQIKGPMPKLARQRFQRELDILTNKVQHRGIVTLFDWRAKDEHPWYISEMGLPFQLWWQQRKQQMKDDPEALVRQAITVIRELSSALAVYHEQGVVHRDVKPGNIILKKGVDDPWPILIDFGIAHDANGERLTPSDDAVGNARFSPDVMRRRLDEVPPWVDVFDISQLLIWMLDEEAPKSHWTRPVAWNYAQYSPAMPEDLLQSLRAFTAACSNPSNSPADGKGALDLLAKLFPDKLPMQGVAIDLAAIADAKKRGQAKRLLIEAALTEEIQSSAPLAEKVYAELRETVLAVVNEISAQEPTARVLLDNPFHYKVIGATDLLHVSVGPPHSNIQLRIKTKIVPQNETPPSNESNRDFWRRHIPDDAICFTFALEAGVPQADDPRYTDGRWITVSRDGSMYIHPLDGDLGTNYSNNDLGGSAKGPGVVTSVDEVRGFAASIFTNELYWAFIAAA